jgi:hypothetical protein
MVKKPVAFGQSYVATHNIPYDCADSKVPLGMSHGGVLKRGQMVWLEEALSVAKRPRTVTAYVEGVGLVAIDPRWLVSWRVEAKSVGVGEKRLATR